MGLSRPWRAAVVALTMAVGVGACGGDPPPPPPPAMVPVNVVPEKVHNGELAFYESKVEGVKEAFSNAGDNSLAADGRVFELRTGDRLVGILQLSTLKHTVDLHNKEHRDQILKQLLPTVRDEILIDETVVWTSVVSQKYTYLWFSEDMFALLTMKFGSNDEFDPELVAEEVVQHSTSSDEWKPLYIDDESEEELL